MFLDRLKNGNGAWLLLVVAYLGYFIFQCWNFVIPVIIPDEYWLLSHAQQAAESIMQGNYSPFFHQGGDLKEGSVYWLLQILCALSARITGLQDYQGYLFIRFFSFLAALSIPVALWKKDLFSQMGRNHRFYALLVFILMPMVWWTGKISGPEIFSLASGIWGLGFIFSLHKRGWFWGGILLALSLSIKLTAFPFFIFALLYFALERQWSSICKLLAVLVGGYIIFNLYLIFAGHGGNTTLWKLLFDPQHIIRIMFVYEWEWDYVFNGGVIYWSFNFITLAGLIFIAFKYGAWKVQASILATALLQCGIMVVNGHYLGWNWFPLLQLLPVAFISVSFQEKPPKRWFYALLLLALPFSMRAIWLSADVKNKAWEIAQHHDQLVHDVENCIQRENPRQIIDASVDQLVSPNHPHVIRALESNIWMKDRAVFTADIQKGSLMVVIRSVAWKVHRYEVAFVSDKVYGKVTPRGRCPTSSDAIDILLF